MGGRATSGFFPGGMVARSSLVAGRRVTAQEERMSGDLLGLPTDGSIYMLGTQC